MNVRALIAAAALAWLPLAGADAGQAGEAIPFKRTDAQAGPDGARVALGTLACLGVAGGAWYWLRRQQLRQPPAAPGAVTLVSSLRLNPKLNLYVVKFGATNYLLTHNEQGTSCIGTMPAAVPPTETLL
jgi:hypothetical protein